MMVSANSNEFRREFQKVLDWYDSRIRPMLENHRHRYNDKGIQFGEQEEKDLEYHVRAYVIDGLLATLNWTILPNIDVSGAILTASDVGGALVIEAPMRNRSNRSLRLDYLGLETRNEAPLLAIETKRPGDLLPMDSISGQRPTHDANSLF